MASLKVATFATGWFWTPDAMLGVIDGVIRTRVGYTGGKKADPSYHSMKDHTESISVDYDPSVISYQLLLQQFWSVHVPTSHCSVQYRSAIFYHDEEQKQLAILSKEELENTKYKSGSISTSIEPAGKFYLAEDYHQKYMLSHHKPIVKALKFANNSEMTNSPIATKLNGYLGGHGSLKKLSYELDKWKVDSQIKQLVLQAAQQNNFNYDD